MKLALGTAQFGLTYGIANKDGQINLDVARSMLQLASDNHIDTIDTAVVYGDSEVRLGNLGVQSFKLVTKIPSVPGECEAVVDWIVGQVVQSLERLATDKVHGILLHDPGQLLGPMGAGIKEALQQLRNSGMVEKIGVSIYNSAELGRLSQELDFDLVQVPLNLVDRRLVTSGWLQRLAKSGVEVHTRSTFLQGLLLMPRNDIPSGFERWSWLWDSWHDWLANHQVSAVTACLGYPLSLPAVHRVVVGADNLNQLKELILAADFAGTDELPDLGCNDERLINPSRWSEL